MSLYIPLPTAGQYQTAKYTKADISVGGALAWLTTSTPVIFTVTGTVLCRVYGVVGATQFTSTGGTGTVAIGVAGATGAHIAATTANGTTNFVANAAWVDSTPTVTAEVLAAIPSAWVLNTGNIIATIATNSMTAGAIVMYCDWIPVTAGASVV